MYGGGSYSLDAIKEIRVTDAFHYLPNDQKQCQIKVSFEECMNQQLVEIIKENCQCIPFEMIHMHIENLDVRGT